MASSISLLIRMLLSLGILALVLHQRLSPHAAGLHQRVAVIFRKTDFFVGPPLNWVRTKVPPLPVGPGLSLDTSHFSILFVLLVALTLL